MTDTFHKARESILHYVLSFCITYCWPDPTAYEGYRRSASTRGFVPTTFNEKDHQIGDLVILQSAPASKWMIGWLREIIPYPGGDCAFAIESLEDQELCNWSNVGLSYFPRDQILEEWRWCDAQYEVRSLWYKMFARYGGFKYRPRISFSQTDSSVTLILYDRWGNLSDKETEHPKKTFPNWRKLKNRTMINFIREHVSA